ncbi:hypothetical protein HB364_31580 [Pseudoflavitalea sp. X16]|uniref:phosphoribosyltransferase family protein n=1 Tax=Paraflavitalea devenefica TaxID=2716334 RepID=UPI0014248597|nr:phosphoribosyltransferase family protein [Paraflavitalea devenefica]NII29663.1 hypothetical protein [Paraflavitalea devenefica]
MSSVYSLHKITGVDAFTFNPADYSRFKFGDGHIAESFGHALANGFLEQHSNELRGGKQLVILPSPYFAIPTASYAMAAAFKKTINRYLAINRLPVAEEAKVHRYKTYSLDYGELDADSRLNLILNDKYYLDSHFLKGKLLIFIDDIKITGSHELVIRNLLKQFSLEEETAYFLYFAQLDHEHIHPRIENELNYYFVKSIHDLSVIIASGNFKVNTRIVKYILNAEFTAFERFITRQTAAFREQLADLAISNGYHEMEEYKNNFLHLLTITHQNTQIWLSTYKKDNAQTLTSPNLP